MMNRRSYTPVVPSIIIPDSKAKCFPVFRSKRHKNPIVQGGTYLLLLRSSPLPWPVKESQFGIELAEKTVDEDPASFKRWISRKEIKSAKM